MFILEAKELRKKYGKKIALDSLSLDLADRSIYGMLGRNGAGKTTFIRLITGLAHPTSGSIRVFGEVPRTGTGRICYLSENIALFPHLSPEENLRLVHAMAKVPGTTARIEEILNRVGLGEAGRKPARSLSLGMKRRLQLAMTVCVKPYELLILDEPTNGLDVEGLIWLKEHLAALRQSGATILLATHSIKEMEELISDYFIIDRGVVVDRGKWNLDSTELIKGYTVVVGSQVSGCLDTLHRNNIKDYKVQGDTVLIQTALEASHLMRLLTENGVYPRAFGATRQTLEQVFLDKTRGSTNNDAN